MNILESVVTGVISGVISAFLFHCGLKLALPKVCISPVIEKREVGGVMKYHIKVVNLRRRFAINIVPYLEVVQHSNGGDGSVLRVKMLPISSETIPYIDPYSKKDENKKYAVRCELPDNLLELWPDDENEYLMFKIFCCDAFSGSGRLFSMEYHQHGSCIIHGRFRTGTSMEINPTP